MTLLAREARFRHPVPVTRAVWTRCVEAPAGMTGQDETGRLRDVLWVCRLAASRCTGGHLTFAVRVQGTGEIRMQTLWAIYDGGDTGAPVITIVCPEDY